MPTKHGFVLIPDRSTLNKAIALNERVEGNKLTLDLELTQPHLTVLQTVFAPGFDYRGALKEFRAYRGFAYEAQTLLGDVTLQATHSLEHILWWNVKNAEWLKTFNSELIAALETKIVKPENADELVFTSPAAEDSYRKTGYERNLEAYEPHLTLAITDEPVTPPIAEAKGERIRFHHLAFVEHGELGQIKKILATESLPVSWDW